MSLQNNKRYVVNGYEDSYYGCDMCCYYDLAENEEPCCICKHGIPASREGYELVPSYYIPSTMPNETCSEPLVDEENEDIINHPNHYTDGGIECIDEMLMVFGRRVVADFCLCNVWKYRRRALNKNGQEDLDKSHWYMAKYKEIMDEVKLYEDI